MCHAASAGMQQTSVYYAGTKKTLFSCHSGWNNYDCVHDVRMPSYPLALSVEALYDPYKQSEVYSLIKIKYNRYTQYHIGV